MTDDREIASAPEQRRLDAPPSSAVPTDYDWAFRIEYLRLLDAEAAEADWREAASLILDLDVAKNPDHAHAVWQAHLSRAQWMTTEGYRHYLLSPSGNCPNG